MTFQKQQTPLKLLPFSLCLFYRQQNQTKSLNNFPRLLSSQNLLIYCMYCCCFDVDGVMLNFEKSFVSAINDYFELNLPEGYVPESYWFSDILSQEQVVEGWNYFIHSPLFGQMEPLVDPVLFNSFFGAYPVHFITNIPPECLEQRKANLRNIGFHFDSAHCAGMLNYEGHPPQNKADVIQSLLKDDESIIFVDDHPDNCINVYEAFPDAEVWLITRKFNIDFEHTQIKRAQNWNDLFERSAIPNKV